MAEVGLVVAGVLVGVGVVVGVVRGTEVVEEGTEVVVVDRGTVVVVVVVDGAVVVVVPMPSGNSRVDGEGGVRVVPLKL